MNSSIETYGGQGGSVATDVSNKGDILPITGVDIVDLILIAIFLAGFGFAIWAIIEGVNKHYDEL